MAERKFNRKSRLSLRQNSGRVKRAIAFAAAACLACALALAGCTGSNASSSSSKELRAGSTAYFYNESLDPAYNWDGWELEYYGVVENLLKLNDEFETEPWLAESVENVDEYTWSIKLRDNITFNTGDKVSAADVKACWERTYQVNTRAAETMPLKSIEADGLSLKVTTSEPVPSFKNVICDPIFCVYQVKEGTDYAKQGTATTGPYKVTEFVFEDHVTLEPNKNYWDGTPQLSKITLRTYLDEDTQTMAMQNGELDVLAMPASSAYKVLSDTTKYNSLMQTSTRADFVRFNLKHPVVANDAVRLAVSYCIDRDGYADTICIGTETPSYGVYSSRLPYGGTQGLNVAVMECSIDKAKAALDAAGVLDTNNDGIRELPDGTPCVINLYNCSAYERFMQLGDDLQAKLQKAGIKLNIHTIDFWLDDTESYQKYDPDMTIDSYGMAPTGDPNYFASMCFASNGSNNFGSYANANVDSLISQLKGEFDQSKRNQIAQAISQQVLNDNAYIFFANSETRCIATTNVKGLSIAPSEYYLITKDTTID